MHKPGGSGRHTYSTAITVALLFQPCGLTRIPFAESTKHEPSSVKSPMPTDAAPGPPLIHRMTGSVEASFRLSDTQKNRCFLLWANTRQPCVWMIPGLFWDILLAKSKKPAWLIAVSLQTLLGASWTLKLPSAATAAAQRIMACKRRDIMPIAALRIPLGDRRL